jgi:hypothetical protein
MNSIMPEFKICSTHRLSKGVVVGKSVDVAAVHSET